MVVHRHAGRIDVSSPLVLDTRPLGRRAGSMRPVARTVDLVDRIGLDLIAVPAGGTLDLDLKMESVVEGVLVTGTVTGLAQGECSRCLEPLSEEVSVGLTELYAYPLSTTETTTGDDEVRSVVDDHVDLTEAVTDAIVLELPLQPVCREDCLGLCAECGERLAVLEPGHAHEMMDPRWAALAARLEAASTTTESIEAPTRTPSGAEDGAAPRVEEM